MLQVVLLRTGAHLAETLLVLFFWWADATGVT